MDDMKELLLLMHNAKGIYRVTPDTDFKMTQMLSMALSSLYVTVTMIGGGLEYHLTDIGTAVAEQYAKEKEMENSEPEFSDYPAFYRNRTNGCVVLAINPTCGMVIKQATKITDGEYSLPIGTFQTCFIPFFVNEEWKCIPTDTFVVKLPKGTHK